MLIIRRRFYAIVRDVIVAIQTLAYLRLQQAFSTDKGTEDGVKGVLARVTTVFESGREVCLT